MYNLKEKLADYKFKTQIPLRFSDMDMFGHANNAVYLTYFEQARSQYWKEILNWSWETYGIVLVKSEIEYIKPVTLNENIWIYIRTSKVGNSSFEMEYVVVSNDGEQEEIRTIGKTKQVTIDYSTKKPTAIPHDAREKMIAADNPEV